MNQRFHFSIYSVIQNHGHLDYPLHIVSLISYGEDLNFFISPLVLVHPIILGIDAPMMVEIIKPYRGIQYEVGRGAGNSLKVAEMYHIELGKRMSPQCRCKYSKFFVLVL